MNAFFGKFSTNIAIYVLSFTWLSKDSIEGREYIIQLQETWNTFAQRRETGLAGMCSTLRDTRKKTLSSHGVVDS